MHILTIPSWYPTPSSPLAGIFFEEQALTLRRGGVEMGVVFPDLRSLRTVGQGALLANRFQTAWRAPAEVPTLCCHGWAPPRMPRLLARLYVDCGLRLVERYMARHGRPALVQAQGARLAGRLAAAARHRFGLPYVVTEHDSAFLEGRVTAWERPLARAVCAEATRLIAVSPALATAMQRFAGRREIHVVPNMVDTDFFTLPPAPRGPPLRFVTVGILTPKKGVDVLLRAFAKAFAGRLDVRLEVGGDGPQRPALVALAQELGLTDRVAFLGRLDRRGVRAALWRAHAYVLASPKETFGIALAEAMATGLPVIATRSGGPESLVTPDVGRLVPPADPDALAAALEAQAASGPTDLGRAAAIRALTVRQLSPRRFVARMQEHYRAALADGARVS